MSTVCGRPQGGGPAHVDRGEGGQNMIFCGHHKWMTPKLQGVLVEGKQA